MALTHEIPKGVSASAKRGAGGPNSVNVHFGRLVAARRLELGLSQEELARRMGTSQPRVRKIEEGEPLSAEARERLTSALGIEPETKPALERARMAPWKSTALAAATVAALWLSAVMVDPGWPRIGLAVSAVAALWLSVFLFERGASFRVPATAVTAVWILVIGVVLIFNGGAPGVSGGRFGAIGAATAGPLALLQAGDNGVDAALSSSAIGNGQSGEAVSALQPVGLSHQVGRCDSPVAAEGGPASVLAVGIDPFPWTGALAIYSRSLVCGAQSGITFAGLTATAASEGVYTFSRRNPPAAGSQSGSPSAGQAVSLSAGKGGSLSAGKGGSAGAVNSVGNTVTQPVSGGGGPVGNVVKPVGTVVKPGPVGNVVKPVGNVVKPVGNVVKPVGNVATPVGNVVNAVGNAVNNSVGQVLKKP